MFPLGLIVSTPGALDALAATNTTAAQLLARHQRGDWGELTKADIEANEEALKTGDRLFSSYQLGKGEKIWIITEWDRSATTLMVPEEY